MTADVPLQIGLLSLGEADLRLSFKTDAASRPVQSSAMLSLGLEFANLDDMRLTLPGATGREANHTGYAQCSI